MNSTSIKLDPCNLNIGEYKFNNITVPKLTGRIPEFSMTIDKEMVWPGGIVDYVIDTSLGKFLTSPPSNSIHY